jgi:hypothetical protein
MKSRTVFLSIAMALMLCHPSAAPASYDPLGSGTAAISFNKRFLALLKSNGVRLEARQGATLRKGGSTLVLPVEGGKLDPLGGKGTVETGGALVFSSGRRDVPLKDIALKTKQTPLLAKVGGSQLKVARAAKVAFERDGFGGRIEARGLTLTQKVATRLDKKLGLGRLLAEGLALGKATAQVEPATVKILPEGELTVSPDPAFLAKLNSVFVSVNPIFPAENQGGVFHFSIGPGGAISPDAASGSLRAEGALEFLQLGGGQVFWRDPVLEPAASGLSVDLEVAPSPPYAGKQGRVPVLATERLVPAVADPETRSISQGSITLRISAGTAATFNEAFAQGRPLFAPGEKLADLAFAARAR